MGYIRHNAIVVTCFELADLESARAIASGLNMRPSEIVESGTNGYVSFFVPPDGSKEGWQNSDAGDEARKKFKDYCKSAPYLDWVEIEYGGDGDTATVTDFRKTL